MRPLVGKIIVLVLVFIAIGLGVAIYLKYSKTTSGDKAPVIKYDKFNPPVTPNASNNNLTADQKIIFNAPGQGASEAQLKTFSELVNKLAVGGDKITIKDCTASPEVLRTKFGSTITVENKGSTDIHFGVGSDRVLVKAGESTKVKIDFKQGPGVYGYGCDQQNLQRSIGVLLVIPAK